MGSRLHGMARRAEQIELNRGSCTEVCRHDVLGRLRMRGGTTELTLAGGTEGSNPAPSSRESFANLTSSIRATIGPRVCPTCPFPLSGPRRPKHQRFCSLTLLFSPAAKKTEGYADIHRGGATSYRMLAPSTAGLARARPHARETWRSSGRHRLARRGSLKENVSTPELIDGS